MTTKHRALIIVTLVVLFTVSVTMGSYFTGYSLVLPIFSNKEARLNIKSKPGDEIAVFSKFDFSKDKWAAYIAISADDFNDLSHAIIKCSCLKTTDHLLLQTMKKTWRFRVTDGDVGTVTSDFYLFKNGTLVYKSGIILDKSAQRLQNGEYGEMIPVDPTGMLQTCKQFKKVY